MNISSELPPLADNVTSGYRPGNGPTAFDPNDSPVFSAHHGTTTTNSHSYRAATLNETSSQSVGPVENDPNLPTGYRPATHDSDRDQRNRPAVTFQGSAPWSTRVEPNAFGISMGNYVGDLCPSGGGAGTRNSDLSLHNNQPIPSRRSPPSPTNIALTASSPISRSTPNHSTFGREGLAISVVVSDPSSSKAVPGEYPYSVNSGVIRPQTTIQNAIPNPRHGTVSDIGAPGLEYSANQPNQATCERQVQNIGSTWDPPLVLSPSTFKI
ncbi:hypothetical protein LOZ58_006897 [Ophidiomyces ophidiicola]|nr:hypothetical protein LOZ58_006897 [Ophidiomyces ophidiicola]